MNEAEAAVVRMMFEWFAGGRTEHGIAKELNELGVPTKRGGKWHPLTVRNVLNHKSYIGLDCYGMYRCRIVLENKGTPQEKKRVVRTLRPESERIEIRGFSPRIMTDELWEAVQRRLAMPRARRGRVRMYLVTGYTRCGKCGTPVNGASNYGDKRRYRCRGTQATSTRGKICDASYIPADELEEAVWGGIVGALTNPAVLLSEMEQYLETGEGDIAGKVSELKKEIRDLRKEEQRWMSLFGKEEIDQDMLRQQVGPVKALREELERTLERLQKQRAVEGDAEHVKALVEAEIAELSEGLKDLDFDGKRAVMGALDVQVTAVLGDVSMTVVVGINPTTTERTSA